AADVAVVLQILFRSARDGSAEWPLVVTGGRNGADVVLVVKPDDVSGNRSFAFSDPAVDSTLVSFSPLSIEIGLDSSAGALDLYVASSLIAEQGGEVQTA